MSTDLNFSIISMNYVEDVVWEGVDEGGHLGFTLPGHQRQCLQVHHALCTVPGGLKCLLVSLLVLTLTYTTTLPLLFRSMSSFLQHLVTNRSSLLNKVRIYIS